MKILGLETSKEELSVLKDFAIAAVIGVAAGFGSYYGMNALESQEDPQDSYVRTLQEKYPSLSDEDAAALEQQEDKRLAMEISVLGFMSLGFKSLLNRSESPKPKIG